MLEITIALFMGLVVCKLTDFVAHFEFPKWLRAVAAMALGVLAAYVFNMDLFHTWKFSVADGMGLVGTGLVFGATASLWHEVLGYVAGHSAA